MQLIKWSVHMHELYPGDLMLHQRHKDLKKKLCYYYCSCCCVCVHADVHVCKPRVHVEAQVQIWGVDAIFYLYGSFRGGTQVTRLARQASLPTEPFHQPH